VLKRISHLVFALVLLAASPALGTTFTFSTSDSPFDPGVANQGWYPSFGANADVNDNYVVGTTLAGSQTFRNFFTFDLASLPGDFTVVSARLRLTRFQSSSENEDFERIEFFDVSTDAATLNNNVGANAAIYADLGSGTSYGAFNVLGDRNSSSPSAVLQFPLNPAALADIESAAGGFFSMGGTLISDDGADFLFGGSTDEFVQELVVEAVPEPGSSGLLMLGLLGLALRRRPRA